MKRTAGVWLAGAVALAGWGPGVGPLEAQPVGSRNLVRIRRVQTGSEATPDYTVRGAQRRITTRDWPQIITEFETAPEWLDEIEIRVFVLLRTRDDRTLVSGTMRYVNLPNTRPGRPHQSTAYLHPNTVARFGDIEAVAVLILHEGQLQDVGLRPEARSAWWEQLTPREGFVLDRMQTPFAMLDFDSEQALKPRADR